MSIAASLSGERRIWTLAGGIAFTGHAAAAALALAWVKPAAEVMPEPVVLVELPPEGGPSQPVSSLAAVQPQVQPQTAQPQMATPPIDLPPVRAPLPQNPVTLPPPVQAPPQALAPARPAAAPAAPTSALAPAPTGAGAGPSTTQGTDPRAKKAEVDYFSLISAHLNRRKTYPTEAKKARQEGVVTVRFTVARDGSVSDVSIRRSSGHDILDAATLQLLQRVAPLPRMPATMARSTVTLSLPIDYSLRTI